MNLLGNHPIYSVMELQSQKGGEVSFGEEGGGYEHLVVSVIYMIIMINWIEVSVLRKLTLMTKGDLNKTQDS